MRGNGSERSLSTASREDGRAEARPLFVERQYGNRCGLVSEYVQVLVATERAIWVSLADGLQDFDNDCLRDSVSRR